MISNIISEDFEVTPAIRDHVDKCLNELLHFVPNTDEDMQVRFFLKQEADQLFCHTSCSLLVQRIRRYTSKPEPLPGGDSC
jgi:hypothetical protein